jgi:hypothetical protein
MEAVNSHFHSPQAKPLLKSYNNVSCLSNDVLRELHKGTSGVIIHEIGHFLAFRRYGINPLYIAINTTKLLGTAVFAATMPKPGTDSILLSGAGVLFENAIFRTYSVDTAYADFLDIQELDNGQSNYRGTNRFPPLSDLASGIPFAAVLVKDYDRKFPTEKEIRIGIRLHDKILQLIDNCKVIAEHRIVTSLSIIGFMHFRSLFDEGIMHIRMATGKYDAEIERELTLKNAEYATEMATRGIYGV